LSEKVGDEGSSNIASSTSASYSQVRIACSEQAMRIAVERILKGCNVKLVRGITGSWMIEIGHDR